MILCVQCDYIAAECLFSLFVCANIYRYSHDLHLGSESPVSDDPCKSGFLFSECANPWVQIWVTHRCTHAVSYSKVGFIGLLCSLQKVRYRFIVDE